MHRVVGTFMILEAFALYWTWAKWAHIFPKKSGKTCTGCCVQAGLFKENNPRLSQTSSRTDPNGDWWMYPLATEAKTAHRTPAVHWVSHGTFGSWFPGFPSSPWCLVCESNEKEEQCFLSFFHLIAGLRTGWGTYLEVGVGKKSLIW